MRRVSLMVFVMAMLAAIAGTRKEVADPDGPDHPSAANVKGGDPAPDSHHASQSAGTPHTDDHLLKTVATIELPKEAVAQPGAVITTSASAAPAPDVSPKPLAQDPALAEMDDDDLNAAAQTELRRVGCYDARIDGQWGRKSKAALEAFGERVGADWSDRPRAELVTALRALPAGHCLAASAQPPAQTPGEARADQSYLPPWMQGAKLSNIETPAAAAPGAQKTLTDAGPAAPKAKRSKNVRRREVRRGRFAQGYERRRGDKSWLPKGWPGGRD